MRFQSSLLCTTLIAFHHLIGINAFAFSPSPISLRSTSIQTNLKSQKSPLTDSSDFSLDTKTEENENSCESSKLTRRTFFTQSSAFAFLLTSSVMNMAPPALAADSETTSTSSSTSKTILITGSNSGIGFNAAYRMALTSTPTEQRTIILACRTLEKAQNAAMEIQNQVGENPNYTLIPKECDLADLSSIQSLVTDLKSLGKTLDVVCLNAGLALNTADKEAQRTKDGFELTVGTNHLGHFYLNSLLLPMIDPKAGRIVVTASGVHDPESPGGKQGNPSSLGGLQGFQDAVSQSTTKFDMIDGSPYDPDKAYKDSKLCNVLFTRELQKRLIASNSNIKAYCFSPGLIVGTGFFRYQNPVFTKVFDIAATNVFKVGETTSYGGGTLAYMALSPDVGKVGDTIKGGLYYDAPPGTSKYGDKAFGNQFNIAEIGKEAKEDAKATELWKLSEKLVGNSFL